MIGRRDFIKLLGGGGGVASSPTGTRAWRTRPPRLVLVKSRAGPVDEVPFGKRDLPGPTGYALTRTTRRSGLFAARAAPEIRWATPVPPGILNLSL